MLFTDRHPEHLAVARHLADLATDDVTPLGGDQRLYRAAVGRRDKDFGHVANLVFLLVGDQLDPVVALLPPVHIAVATPYPKVGRAAHLVPLSVAAAGSHPVAARLLWPEGRHGLAVLAAGHGCCEYRGVLAAPLPVEIPVFGLPAHTVPTVFHENNRQGYTRHRLAVPIHGEQIHLLLLAHPGQVAARRHAGIERALVDNRCPAAAHLLAVEVGHTGLDSEKLALGLCRELGWHLESDAPRIVHPGLALGDELPIAAIGRFSLKASPLKVGPTVPGAALARWTPVPEPIVAAQHAPVNIGPGHRPAKVVACLGADLDRLPAQIALPVCADRHLVLRLSVLGHLEAGAGIELLVRGPNLDAVDSQRRLLVQQQAVAQAAHVVELQVFFHQLFARGVLDQQFHALHPSHRARRGLLRQVVVSVIVGAYDALEKDGLARPVDGPVGVQDTQVLAGPEL